MQIWALANQKGGTGKTTTAIHLAAALAAQGERCLLVDLDPQAHATLGLGRAVEDRASIASCFLQGTPLEKLVGEVPGGFHLVPSELRLREFEEIAERSLRPERILQEALAPLADRYDWVLVDCPPRADGVLCANAIRAADTTCLVVETGVFALQGTLGASRIFEARARLLDRSPRLAILATLYDRQTSLARELLIALQARFGARMLDTVIRRDDRLREAAACGLPVQCFAPHSHAALDFEALAREVLTHRFRPSSGREELVLSSSGSNDPAHA